MNIFDSSEQTPEPGMRRGPPHAQRAVGLPTVEFVVQSAAWNARRNLKQFLRKALAQAAATTGTGTGELAVVLTSDLEMRGLNNRWRGKDAATNVLSFPGRNVAPAGMPLGLLGDIVIAYETCAREAREQQVSFSDHLAHLVVHGFLHLIGYDHVAPDEAHRMEALEATILARLDIANPYAAKLPAAEA
jgi:probable rRNA maturation factor